MKNSAAFTLVEMSIVIIIIGLIIGGIATGQGMIKAAKVNSLARDAEKYQAALNIFELKYDTLPGDLSNATDYWPANSLYTGYATASGDGNGRIDSPSEKTLVFQHLSSAGMIEGDYDYQAAGGRYPKTQFDDVSARIATGNNYIQAYRNTFGYNIPENNNSVLFSAHGTFGAPNNPGAGFLSPQDVYSLDKKLDDGNAGTGSILGISGMKQNAAGWETTCANLGANPPTYYPSNSDTSCAVLFIFK